MVRGAESTSPTPQPTSAVGVRVCFGMNVASASSRSSAYFRASCVVSFFSSCRFISSRIAATCVAASMRVAASLCCQRPSSWMSGSDFAITASNVKRASACCLHHRSAYERICMRRTRARSSRTPRSSQPTKTCRTSSYNTEFQAPISATIEGAKPCAFEAAALTASSGAYSLGSGFGPGGTLARPPRARSRSFSSISFFDATYRFRSGAISFSNASSTAVKWMASSRELGCSEGNTTRRQAPVASSNCAGPPFTITPKTGDTSCL
mmetsp:Transcript_26843/g.93215  ORF Transcript_26843/g.93215 Transcript_26843/m.93215 type:complete len:266 (+) Transcript_26843:1287-2084(+)